jgi:hypothetical protein
MVTGTNGQAPALGDESATLAQDESLTAALQLGWRVAELYAHVEDTGEPSNDTLLPAHQSLEPADQLELQLRAAGGDARRAGIISGGAALEQLLPSARRAPASPEAAEAFRAEVRRCHIELDKDLWARDESAGKAYELGNGMSDTYSRIRRAYAGSREERTIAWTDAFAPDRIARLKKLLDDLQSRLNAAGVAVVRRHLDEWCDSVPDRIEAAGGPPPLAAIRDGLRRQTVIWRQLIAGDKEPEAYLGSDARAEVREELRELAWRRYSRWVVPAAGVLFALVFFLPQILSWYHQSVVGSGVASAAVAITGALGITKASVLVTVRSRLHQWSALLWDRAVVNKVSDETLVLDAVLPPPATKHCAVAGMAAEVGRRTKQTLAERLKAAPTPQARTRSVRV